MANAQGAAMWQVWGLGFLASVSPASRLLRVRIKERSYLMTTYTPVQQGDQPAPERVVGVGRVAQKYANPYMAGILLGIVLFLSFFITGSGLGASGGMNRLLAAAEEWVIPAHVENTAYLAAIAGEGKNPLDNWVVFVTLGTLIGGAASGILHGRFKVETNRGPRVSVRLRWVLAFAGGAFMGFGARMARGCTSGQALSGGAVLSVGSWAFMFAVFGGAYALAYFVRRLWN